MKINRRNPWHWVMLGVFGANVALALLLRPFLRRDPRRVLLYGHKLNGNLLALYLEAEKSDVGVELEFLTMDLAYHRSLRREGIRVLWAGSPRAAWRLGRADAIVTDHGLHVMAPLPRFTKIRFYDVWHGIPFKGFDADDFRTQHRYRETWVTSPFIKRLYVEKFGFREDQVVVTGYARTDRLVNATQSPAEVREELGLPPDRKLILFAPTWKQDAEGRSVFPFGMDEAAFMGRLSSFAEREGCSILLRPHLNTPLDPSAEYPHVHVLSSRTYPDAEEILLASDVLVCDWSSIAFDFLLLDRPTLFLDVGPPFRKGFSLGPEFRFDRVVRGADELEAALEQAVVNPVEALSEQALQRDEIKKMLYGPYADGQSARRCLDRLVKAPR
ncbi:CDP-glycerol--glycerophosphate glycerophosphotransferase [Guyparkeria sp. SB14A]|nr:CDP-glycerol--glycerophosphate glycerophosphotransferase [Guyparkeria sp. SB14A]